MRSQPPTPPLAQEESWRILTIEVCNDWPLTDSGQERIRKDPAYVQGERRGGDCIWHEPQRNTH